MYQLTIGDDHRGAASTPTRPVVLADRATAGPGGRDTGAEDPTAGW